MGQAIATTGRYGKGRGDGEGGARSDLAAANVERVLVFELGKGELETGGATR